METLQKLFQDYIAYAGQLREETASVKSVLGMRDREIYDAGHKAFDKAVEDWAIGFSREHHSQEELSVALEVILLTAADYAEKSPYWYLCAVQRHAAKLIPLLDETHCAVLRERFEQQYPNGKLPIQREIQKLLEAKVPQKKRRFLRFR